MAEDNKNIKKTGETENSNRFNWIYDTVMGNSLDKDEIQEVLKVNRAFRDKKQ